MAAADDVRCPILYGRVYARMERIDGSSTYIWNSGFIQTKTLSTSSTHFSFLFLFFSFSFFFVIIGIYELDSLAQSYRLRDELDFSLYLALIILLFW
jgi:hypothetical protein